MDVQALGNVAGGPPDQQEYMLIPVRNASECCEFESRYISGTTLTRDPSSWSLGISIALFLYHIFIIVSINNCFEITQARLYVEERKIIIFYSQQNILFIFSFKKKIKIFKYKNF